MSIWGFFFGQYNSKKFLKAVQSLTETSNDVITDNHIFNSFRSFLKILEEHRIKIPKLSSLVINTASHDLDLLERL